MTDKLDTLLTRNLSPERDNALSSQRVLAALEVMHLPRQKQRFINWPPFLLRWDFAPAWPRVAALAGCTALGFAIGLAGLDASPDGASAGVFRTRTDIVSVIGETDPLTDAFR